VIWFGGKKNYFFGKNAWHYGVEVYRLFDSVAVEFVRHGGYGGLVWVFRAETAVYRVR
jgi:hypothetical protein